MVCVGSPKISIFDTVKGAHDNRFVAFNDIPLNNSKYHKQIGADFQLGSGRTKILDLPFGFNIPENMPDYDPNFESVQVPLTKGSVDFSLYSSRKPFIPENPLLQPPITFYSPKD